MVEHMRDVLFPSRSPAGFFTPGQPASGYLFRLCASSPLGAECVRPGRGRGGQPASVRRGAAPAIAAGDVDRVFCAGPCARNRVDLRNGLVVVWLSAWAFFVGVASLASSALLRLPPRALVSLETPGLVRSVVLTLAKRGVGCSCLNLAHVDVRASWCEGVLLVAQVLRLLAVHISCEQHSFGPCDAAWTLGVRAVLVTVFQALAFKGWGRSSSIGCRGHQLSICVLCFWVRFY